jgi:pSer/pThr/pTyr-binding forkhead associated (FHA) protein
MTASLVDRDSGQRITVPTTGLTIGRGPDQRGGLFHVIANRAVSQHHCRIWRDQDGWRVEDLDSANGTYVDEEMVVGAAPLASGNVLRIGYGGSIGLVATFESGEVVAKQTVVEQQPDTVAVELQRKLTDALAELENLRDELAKGHTIRRQAEERETQARLREREARISAENCSVELGVLQIRLSEANAVAASRVNDLATAREKLLVAETRSNELADSLRRELALRLEHTQHVEAKLTRAEARSIELELAVTAANGARDSALDNYEQVRGRVAELECVLAEQGELLRSH